METVTHQKRVALVYDNGCPACRFYVELAHIKDSVAEIELIGARTEHPLVGEVLARGYDLNTGFVLVVGDTFYHGEAAIHQLALLGSRHRFFNRVNYWIFASPTRSRIIYPVLAAGRRALLWVLGIRPI